MAKKKTIDNDTLNMLNGLGSKAEQTFKETREKERKILPFKKPNSDYYRLDLVVRNNVPGAKGHNVMVEEIKTDYKAYLDSVRGNMSITKYIHKLIDSDMKRTHYKELLRDTQNK